MTPNTFAGRLVVAAGSLAVTAALLTTVVEGPAHATPSGHGRPTTTKAKPVAVQKVRARQVPDESAAQRAAAQRSAALQSRTVEWPSAGSAVVGGAHRRAQVGVVRARTSRGATATKVSVLGQAQTRRAGLEGVLVRVTPSSPTSGAGPVTVAVDYSKFANAYGADWGGRLQVIAYPSCLAATPKVRACQQGTVLKNSNDTDAEVISATLSGTSASASAASRQAATSPASGGAVLLAVTATAASASGTGNFTATPLSASSSWTAGGSAGDFTWSYPFRVPPSLNGPAPKLSLSYSAQSVDGRTAATNNQSSQVGEGFDLGESYIERGYVSCDDDGVTGKYDQCWKTDNATLVMNGAAAELVKAADGTWRMKNDDGSRIRRLTSTASTNLDNDKEYWEYTSAQGVRYYFGRTAIPGQTGDTQSLWYAPVAGDDAGEPCHGTTFAASFCNQAWRWNLDYVVDLNGNAMSYWYAAETNNYAKNKVASPGAKYVRGGRLTRIDYGLRDGVATTNAPMRVTFTNAVRCLAATGCDSYSKTKWPDTPYDQICADGATCTGEFAPSFFNRYRLSKITTSVLKGGAYQSVDSWTFNQQFLNSGEVSDSTLWLSGISHAGLVGGTVTLPDVTFTPTQLVNRVDSPSDGISALPRFRLRTIRTEAGALTTVNYSATDCSPSSKPTPETNTRRCFPQKWTPQGNTSPRTDWFHKYVVTDVTDADTTGLAPPKTVYYTYSGGGAWAYDDNKLVADSYRTWSDWRGYQTVKTVVGDPSLTSVRSQTVDTFLRGMDGDKLPSGTRNVTVADSTGTTYVDKRPLAGFKLESVSYTQEGGSEFSGTITEPWVQTTAGSGLKGASFVRPATVSTRTAWSTGGVHRQQTTTTYNPLTGQPTRVSATGDTAVSGDETCVATQYADTMTVSGAWMVGFPVRSVKSVGTCGADALSPTETNVISDTRTRYDNLAQGVAPAKGQATTTERLAGYSGSTPVYQAMTQSTYDGYGRVTAVTEPLDAGATTTTTTAYTNSADGTLASTLETVDSGGKKQATTTTFAPEWGVPTKVSDPNAKVTESAYDALGRATSVWATNRARSATPSVKYAYAITNTAASSVTTSTLNRDGTGYRTSVDIYDSLLRPRQSQTPSPSGGRVLSGTTYDARGLGAQSYTRVYASGAPDGTLVQFSDGVAPALTKTTYDGLGRATRSSLSTFNTQRWSTVTTYDGADKVTVDQPDGAPTTVTESDLLGRVTRQTEVGTPDLVTSFEYDGAGNKKKIVGPGGTWTYQYDVRGRRTDTTDPDAGATHYTYTDNDLVETVTDARDESTLTVYDTLSRPIGRYEGTSVDPTKQLASWTYDTLMKGYPTSSTRYVGGSTGDRFTSTITGYNAAYNVTDSKLSVAAAAGGTSDLTSELPASLSRSTVYNVDQSIDLDYLPRVAVGGTVQLSSEALQYTYDALGEPVSLSGRSSVVQDTVYDQLGQPQQYVLGAGPAAQLYVVNSFDEGTGRLTRSLATTNVSAAVVSDHRLTYDDAGNPTRDANTATGDTQCFRYDDHRRLSSAWTPSSGDCAPSPSAGLLGGPAPYWQSWTFTAAGLRDVQTTTTPNGTTVADYDYPVAGDAHRNTVTQVTASGFDPGTSSYEYDATGNTSSRPGPEGVDQDLSWDSEGRLEDVTAHESGGDRRTRYVYSVDGQLLLTDNPDEKVLYFGDTEVHVDKQAAAASRVSALRNYATWAGPVATRSSDSRIDFTLPDQQGTAGVALDSATLTPARRYLTPYGEQRGTPAAAWPTSRDFLGKVLDESTGLHSVGARYYDAGIGRFISVDPVLDTASAAQMLGYSYANNNPVAMADPSGLRPVDMNGNELPYNPVTHEVGPSPHPMPPPPSLAAAVQTSTVLTSILYYQPTSQNTEPPKDTPWYKKLGGGAKDYLAGAFAGTTDLLPLNVSSSMKMGCRPGSAAFSGCLSAPTKSNSELLFDQGQYGVDDDSKSFFVGYWLGIPSTAAPAATGEKGLTRLMLGSTKLAGKESATVADRAGIATSRLQSHVDKAVADYDSGAISMSSRQARAAARNSGLEATFRGQVIDRAVKNAVRNDPQLSHLWVSRSGEYGPDFHDLSTGTWWDVTTPGQWSRHVDQYSDPFGYGIGLFTR